MPFTFFLVAQYGDHGPCPNFGCLYDRYFHIHCVSRLEFKLVLRSFLKSFPKQGFMGSCPCRPIITFVVLETKTDGA